MKNISIMKLFTIYLLYIFFTVNLSAEGIDFEKYNEFICFQESYGIMPEDGFPVGYFKNNVRIESQTYKNYTQLQDSDLYYGEPFIIMVEDADSADSKIRKNIHVIYKNRDEVIYSGEKFKNVSRIDIHNNSPYFAILLVSDKIEIQIFKGFQKIRVIEFSLDIYKEINLKKFWPRVLIDVNDNGIFVSFTKDNNTYIWDNTKWQKYNISLSNSFHLFVADDEFIISGNYTSGSIHKSAAALWINGKIELLSESNSLENYISFSFFKDNELWSLGSVGTTDAEGKITIKTTAWVNKEKVKDDYFMPELCIYPVDYQFVNNSILITGQSRLLGLDEDVFLADENNYFRRYSLNENIDKLIISDDQKLTYKQEGWDGRLFHKVLFSEKEH